MMTAKLSCPVYMKNILKHWTFCPTSLTFLLDILCPISDMLNDISYISSSLPRTLCPTFCNKTSDIEAKTLDMSGCPTTFRFHCMSYYVYIRQHSKVNYLILITGGISGTKNSPRRKSQN